MDEEQILDDSKETNEVPVDSNLNGSLHFQDPPEGVANEQNPTAIINENEEEAGKEIQDDGNTDVPVSNDIDVEAEDHVNLQDDGHQAVKMQEILEEVDEEGAAYQEGEEGLSGMVSKFEQPIYQDESQLDMEYDSQMPQASERLSPEHPEYGDGEQLFGDEEEGHEQGDIGYPSVERFEATTPTHHEEEGEFVLTSRRTPQFSEVYGEEEDEVEEDEEELVLNREALIESYREALQEKKQLHEQNMQLQNKLGEYFRKRKADSEVNARLESDKASADHEQRYVKYVSTLDELRRQFNDMQDEYRNEIESLKVQCSEKQTEVDEERSKFTQYKKGVGLKSISSRTGRPLAPAELEELLENEYRKETDVVAVRLENIKLQNQLRKEEMILKSKEELAEGLHMIDFEQLKIENQTYNEKIEERNEELMKLKKKITSTVQILTHVKEKLQFVEQENQYQRQKQLEVDVLLKEKRDKLAKMKQKRDALRMENHRLKQNCGLLGNEALLRNFEECVDTVDDRKNRLEAMRKDHAQLTLTTKGYLTKIAVARSSKN